MSPERHPRAGKRIWIASACLLLMVANIAVNGPDRFCVLLYAILLVISVPSLWGMFVACSEVGDRRLRASLFWVCGILAISHIILTPLWGVWMFSSARTNWLHNWAAFLSATLVTISPGLVRMSFSTR